MTTRSFLKPLSVILAALASGAAGASTDGSKDSNLTSVLGSELTKAVSSDAANVPTKANSAQDLLIHQNGDIFKFVLSRAKDGNLFAQHVSHESHSSHASHRSHYSSAP